MISKDGANSSVQSEIQDLQGRLEKEVKIIEQYRHQKEALTEQLAKTIREKEISQQNLRAVEQELADLKDKLSGIGDELDKERGRVKDVVDREGRKLKERDLKERELEKEIETLLDERKQFREKWKLADKELKEAQEQVEKLERDKEYRQGRFEDAIRKTGELEDLLKQQEESLVKRGQQLTEAYKENNYYKDMFEKVERKYGSIEKLKQRLELADMKESKVAELLEKLTKSMVSTNR